MSEPVAPAPEGEVASLDQVVQERVRREPQQEPAAEAEAPEIEAEPTAETDEQPEEVVAEEQEEVAPEEPAIDPPKSWDAEAKAVFQTLSREAQAVIATREADRDRAVSQANQQANDVKKQAEKAFGEIGQYKARLDDLLPKALETFKSRWEGIDWVQWTRDDPIAALEGKALWEQEQAQLDQLQAAHRTAEATEYQQFVATEAEKLPAAAPDLADPEKGAERKRELGQFLQGQGYTSEQLKWIGATDLALAYDAMRYRQLKDKAQAELTKPRPAAAAQMPVRPATGGAATPKTARIAELEAKANRTGRLDDVIALRAARRAASRG